MDAAYTALAALRGGQLAKVCAEDKASVLRLLSERRKDLVREHRAGHSRACDFASLGRSGGLRTLALYGQGWFALLARRRWKEIIAEQLVEVFALLLCKGRP